VAGNERGSKNRGATSGYWGLTDWDRFWGWEEEEVVLDELLAITIDSVGSGLYSNALKISPHLPGEGR
jgi:hypothetical protein